MNGIINCYKPEGITSFDAVAKIRRVSHEKKVGHTGTLDPAASGVLPICLGKATKLIDIIMQGRKIYRVEMTLGVTTDTYDKEGEVISTMPVTVSEKDIMKAVQSFQGDIMQIPPMYSALKHNGKRLYELAREGIEIQREPRQVSIYKIDVLNISGEIVNFDVQCSKGTYIRSLCYDIGARLGCGAMMSNLIRLQSGEFRIDGSINVLELNEDNINDYIISMDKALECFPALTADCKFEKLLRNGVKINDKSFTNKLSEGLYRVFNNEQELLGLGEMSKDTFRIITLLI